MMISVMNGNDFELDRNADLIEAEAQPKARVSAHAGAFSSDNVVSESGNRGSSSDFIESVDSIRVLVNDDVADTSVSTIYLDNLENSRGEKIWVDEEMKDGDDETRRVDDHEFSARNSETEQWGIRVETPRASDHEGIVWNSGVGHLEESRVGKGHVDVGKPSVSQYETMISMFDEFAANEKSKAVGGLASVGYGYEVGDMVWGKVKSHPWWPGHIYNEAFASPSVRRTKRAGDVLVAFFGDNSYGWFDPAELILFDPNFSDKSRQTNSRNFVKAVEDAVDEATRRCGLGLACRCRNPYNFRATDVEGYFAVDVDDYELGGVYSANQIRKARNSFRSRDTLAFMKQLALMPRGDGHENIDIIKNKATMMAYRKAVFEEFDETYAQAFGAQPVRSTREPMQAVTQPARAPLSGPMVIAEALGKRKNSTKHHKAKDQPDEDKYLFKKRDEQNELKIQQKGQTTLSMQPSYAGEFMEFAAGDHVLQKRSPALSPKQQIPAKLEQMVATGMDVASASSRVATGEEVVTTEDKPVAARFSVAGSLATGNKVEPLASFADDSFPNLASDYASQPPNLAAKVKQTHGQDVLPAVDAKFQVQDPRIRMDIGIKKAKLVKRPAGETAPGEKKKKRKLELGMEMNSDRMLKRAAASLGRLTVIPQIEHQKKDGGASGVLFSDSVRPPSMVGMGNFELKLPQLLDDLQALALNPFHGMERNSPAIIRQAFLNFRSHVYQKSLALSSSAEMESIEIPSSENFKGLPSSKPQKPLLRSDDPMNGGRKRVPSDRQEEVAAKRLKKINYIKSMAVEKKAAQRTKESQRDGKETVASRPSKSLKADFVKKTESSVKKAPERTVLVMKFPPNTGLPTGFELKARLARFGPLDHSRTRIFWESSTIRVVFIHRADAEAAHRHITGNNTLFGSVNVRCTIRPLDATATATATAAESEAKVQREDDPMTAAVPALRQPVVQLKSCLKKPVADDAAAGGGGRGTPRVKFVLGGGESSSGGGEQLMVGNKNNFNNASFAHGGGASSSFSSSSHRMDFMSKNFQRVVSPSSLPPFLPLPPQFQNPPNTLHYTESPTHKNTRNFPAGPGASSNNDVDIAHEMLSLLTKCNDVVNNLVCNLGYLPYHPL